MTRQPNQEEIRRIFDEATDLPSDQRDAFVSDACGGDRAIEAEVRSLLKHFETQVTSGDEGFRNVVRTPDRLGVFEIVHEIGKGGMGVVYLARQDSPRRNVAIKVMHPGAMHPGSLARFRQETQLLGRLQHPSIASVFEAHLDEPGVPPYFVMEHVEGETLEKYITKHNLSIDEVVELIAKIADGVHAAHQRGVIHRDLKPGNILVNDEGKPKILDFGIARLVEPGDVTIAPQTVGGFLGTIPYMSPEQLGGSADDPDIRVDVYSLGVVAFQCLERRLPFDVPAGNPLAAAQQILDTPTPRLSSQASSINPDLARVVAKAMARDREDRYESAAAFAADLRRVLRFEPVTAVGRSGWYAARKFVRRNRLAVLIASVAAVAALSTSVLILIQSSRIAAAEKDLREERDALRASETRLVDSNLKLESAAMQVGGQLQMLLSVFSAPAVKQYGLETRLELLLDAMFEGWKEFAGKDSLGAAIIAKNLSPIFSDLGDHTRAAEILGQGIRVLEEKWGPDYPLVLDLLPPLAFSQMRLGDVDAARATAATCVNRVDSTSEVIQARLAFTTASLIEETAGKPQDALRLREQEISWLMSNGYEQHALEAQAGLAMMFNKTGQNNMARSLVQELLEKTKDADVSDDVSVRQRTRTLEALAWIDPKAWPDYEPEYFKLKQGTSDTVGRDLAGALLQSARASRDRGDFALAREKALQAAGIFSRTDGSRSYSVAESRAIAAESLWTVDVVAAKSELEAVTILYREIAPVSDLLSQWPSILLLQLECRQNQVEEARRRFSEVVSQADALGDEGIAVRHMFEAVFARELAAIGRTDAEVVGLLESVIRRCEDDARRYDSVRWTDPGSTLARVYGEREEYEAAFGVLKRVLSLDGDRVAERKGHVALALDAARNLGACEEMEWIGPEVLHLDLDLSQSLNEIGAWQSWAGALDNCEQFESAQAVLRQVIEATPESSVARRSALAGLALSFDRAGRRDEAVRYFRKALALKSVVSGPALMNEHQQASLASCLVEIGEFAEAEALFLEVLPVFERELGRRHSYWVTSVGYLKRIYEETGRFEAAAALAKSVEREVGQ